MDKILKICLINVMNKDKNTAMNKDLNGGFGTSDNYGTSIPSKIIKFIKWKSIHLPIISFAFLQAILNEKGYTVDYFEKNLPEESRYDLILIYGSIVDYKNENRVCRLLKNKFSDAKVGFFGPFPSTNPDLFSDGDFILIGEAEAFFMNEFKDVNQLNGRVYIKSVTDMEKLPSPCFDGFPIKDYSYYPAISKKPFLVLQASLGCPYSCRFYCVYGKYQGAKIRQRSPKKVVDDIMYIQRKYGVKGVQFRDPVFGLTQNFIAEFCSELKSRNVRIVWGMETRLDLLNKNNIKQMFDVGLRNINIGIETNNLYIANRNKRKLVESKYQEEIIKFCEKLGVNISAFYILGYEGDTEETIRNMISYSIKLNTLLARFAVSTPYPGTEFYNKLDNERRLFTKDFEDYNQFTLVYKHENLSKETIQKLLEKAYHRYYFRAPYVITFLKWQIKGFLL